jgi:type IV fimbrial biogenesis protein FimT
MKRRNEIQGFSLFELLIVMAIAGILLTIGVPSMTDFVRNSRLNSATMQIMGDLNMARAEAIKRNKRVLICSGTIAGCVANANWAASGWVVCYDDNRDGVCDAAPADGSDPNPFLVRSALSAQGIVFVAPVAPIVYNPIGTQGVIGAAPLVLNISGNWPGTKLKNLTVSPTGTITSY